MNEIIQYISTNWVPWFCTGVVSFVGLIQRRAIKKMDADRRKNIALYDGMQALLRDRIIQAYNHYQDKGYCPIYGKENVKRMYDAYHVLGGNDVATGLKDKLLKMPEEPAEREDRNYEEI